MLNALSPPNSFITFMSYIHVCVLIVDHAQVITDVHGPVSHGGASPLRLSVSSQVLSACIRVDCTIALAAKTDIVECSD